MTIIKKLKINAPINGHKIGDIVSVHVDCDGQCSDRYWRRRLKDAKIDNCVEFVQEEQKKQESKQESKKEIKGEK